MSFSALLTGVEFKAFTQHALHTETLSMAFCAATLATTLGRALLGLYSLNEETEHMQPVQASPLGSLRAETN